MSVFNKINVTEPAQEEFIKLAKTHRIIPVHKRILADTHTPVSLYSALTNEESGSFLIESASHSSQGAAWSRYSFIGLPAAATLTEQDGQVIWQGEAPKGFPLSGNVLDAVRATINLLKTDALADLPPFTSGLVGFLGWDIVQFLEKMGRTADHQRPEDDLKLPLVAMNLVGDIAVYDNLDSSVLLIANVIVDADASPSELASAWNDAVARIQAMSYKLTQKAPVQEHRQGGTEHADASLRHGKENNTASSLDLAEVSRWDKQDFLDTIIRCKQDIVDGEVFQIVLSQRFDIPTTASALEIYRALRVTNPSPYMYLFNFTNPRDDSPYSLIGSSPEALVTVKSRKAISHPIAGSRPRGETLAEDHALTEELKANEKERAEHVMLVDLIRNDLSKVAEAGTVSVDDYAFIEKFSHIMHMSSEVSAVLAEPYTSFDVLLATFPAGTLSGAPKPRALQLIDEYEPTCRSVYGGVVGYFDFAGNMDVAIAIRTAILTGSMAYVQAGAGIVSDSDPEAEYQESVNKAKAVTTAIANSHYFTSDS